MSTAAPGPRAQSDAPVAIIGAGWAGCAAAIGLAQRGVPVVLFEASAVPGGRARRVDVDGLPLDNGQHLLLGAYAATRRAVAAVHGAAAAPWHSDALAIAPFARRRDAFALAVPRLPAPLHLLAGLLAARGLSGADKRATLAWFARQRRARYACAPAATVADVLAGEPAAVRAALWEPLCIAALNTPPAVASGQLFLNVLAGAFDAQADASDTLLPDVDLSALFPARAVERLRERGHPTRLRTRATVVAEGPRGAIVRAGGAELRCRAAIVAVAPHQLAHALAPELAAARPALAAALARVAAFAYEPITTVWLGFARRPALPPGLVRLDDDPGQWLFDRPDVVARAAPGGPRLAALWSVVISASGRHDALPQEGLVRAVVRQLRRARKDLPHPTWSQVIAERRATYACTAGLARPAAGPLDGALHLAGDYTDDRFPATLEAAVRSGEKAALGVLAALGR